VYPIDRDIRTLLGESSRPAPAATFDTRTRTAENTVDMHAACRARARDHPVVAAAFVIRDAGPRNGRAEEV
jgi:hypothetical protein